MKELSWHDRGRLWLRLGVRLALTLLGLWAIARLGPPLISLFAPFLLAAVMAWMLSPVVKWLNRRLRLPRKALSLALLLLVFAALGAGLWALLAGIGREIITLAGNWESLVASLQATSEAVGNLFSRGMALLPAAAQATVDGLVSQFFTWLETVIPRILSTAVDSLTAVAKGLPSFTVATVVFIIASYFITADYPRLRSGLADRLPNGPRAFLGQVKRAASAGFGGYVKAQVILSIGVFFILVGGFLLIRQPYALLLALGLAVLDFIPILGAGTVMVPWAVVDSLYRKSPGRAGADGGVGAGGPLPPGGRAQGAGGSDRPLPHPLSCQRLCGHAGGRRGRDDPGPRALPGGHQCVPLRCAGQHSAGREAGRRRPLRHFEKREAGRI